MELSTDDVLQVGGEKKLHLHLLSPKHVPLTINFFVNADNNNNFLKKITPTSAKKKAFKGKKDWLKIQRQKAQSAIVVSCSAQTHTERQTHCGVSDL